jgi:acyl-CoA synthetase (AMP-forming)/AMP-acid ligase II
MNTTDFLSISLAICPQRECVVFEGRRFSFEEINDRVNRLAHWLRELGVGKGDRVGMMQVNCNHHVEAYYAAAKIGAIYVPLNYRLKESELEYSLNHSEIKILLVGDGMMKPHLVQRAKAEGISNVVFLDPVTKTRLAGLMQSADLGLMTLQNVPAFYRGTSPNKFFDFIAAGKPVLNNYPGWLADMISAHRCGLVVPPDDPEAFADALEYASANRDEVARMGRAARQLAREEFDRDLLANRFCSLLESVGTAARRTGQ